MKCWYCKGSHMNPSEDLGEGWYKCDDCGATWINQGKLGKLVKVGGSAPRAKKKPR